MKIALIGYGKMGKAIEEIAEHKGHQIILKISGDNRHELTPENIRKADVAIEFSEASAAVKNLKFCFDQNIPVVCGTTGWLSEWDEVIDYCKKKKGTLLYASNFSIGVNLFFEVNKKLATLMADQQQYDVTLKETHHIHKKDAPSGTAISLAEQIIGAGKKDKWLNHQAENNSELTVISIRKDDVPGTHTVAYTSGEDVITITHQALNRKGFAAGALAAVLFLKNKKGVFTMKDVLGL